MKHHFGEWSTDRTNLGGFAKIAIREGDHFTHCTRCNVFTKIPAGQQTKKFWLGGAWVGKAPCKP